MNPKDAIKISVFAGEIMLKNGAEVYRVEDTMKRILKKFNYEFAEAFVTVTAIIVSIDDKEQGLITMLKRITDFNYNLDKIALVNQFSRDLSDNKINFDEAMNILNDINERPPYPYILKTICTGLASFSLTFMFNGSFSDSIVSLVIGLIVYILRAYLFKKEISGLIINMISSFIISLLTLVSVNYGFGMNNDIIIISSITPYLPGLLLTNGIRDIFANDFLSGLSRLINAVLLSVSLASGVGLMFKIWFLLGGR